MKFYQGITVILYVVLGTQILSLNPVFYTPDFFSYGNSTQRVFPFTSYSLTTPLETIYSANINQEYNSLVFVGDIMLARNVEVLIRGSKSDYPFVGINLRSLSDNPALIGNFEASIPKNHQPTPMMQLNFSVDPNLLGGLKSAGFSHLSLANNHSFDNGDKGFQNTVQELTKENFSTFGHETEMNETTTYLSVNGKRIAIVGLNATNPVIEYEKMNKAMESSVVESDWQIVYIHWGQEYETKHDKTQKRIAEMLVDAGADLIVGHHPHVVQDIDIIDGVPVFYSLGNYVFDQYFSEAVQTGLALTLELGEQKEINLLPVTSLVTKSQPTVMNPKDHQAFLNNLAATSHPSLAEEIRNGRLMFGIQVATSSKMAIMSQ